MATRVDAAAVLAEAQRLASIGWPVFPCVPGQKRPLTAHGLLDATTDLDQIRRWWRRTPTANLAVPTGARTIDVLDVDHRPAGSGFGALHRLADAALLTGHTRVVATPSRGLHVYFAGSDQHSARLPEHYLDFKAAGGYVLVAPSVVDGRPYVVVRNTTTSASPLRWNDVRDLLQPSGASAPAWATDPRTVDPSLAGRWSGRDPVTVLASWVARLPEGRRNNGTYWAACRAAQDGHTDLRPIIAAARAAGLSELEARRTVNSAERRYAPKQPQAPAAGPVRATPAGPRSPRARR